LLFIIIIWLLRSVVGLLFHVETVDAGFKSAVMPGQLASPAAAQPPLPLPPAPCAHNKRVLHEAAIFCYRCSISLQCFDAVGWAAGRASGLEKLSVGVLAWLSVWSEMQ